MRQKPIAKANRGKFISQNDNTFVHNRTEHGVVAAMPPRCRRLRRRVRSGHAKEIGNIGSDALQPGLRW
jgi:hypothetical protein